MTHCGSHVFATQVGLVKLFNTKQNFIDFISFISGLWLNLNIVVSAHKKERLDNDKKKRHQRDFYLIFYNKMNETDFQLDSV